MRFEELVAVWSTQADKPLFSLNEFGIHMALYQQRERARRRHFWGMYFPYYVTSLYMLGAIAFTCVAFYFKDTSERDFPMDIGDWIAFAVAAGMFAFAAGSMWRARKRHERLQNSTSPSLRQEIDSGIAQLQFEIHTGTSAEAWRNSALVSIGGVLFCWEVGRLNGDAAPWRVVLVCSAVYGVAALLGWIWARRWRADRARRTRALETLRAKLDETAT
jgi:hypothetical protein